MKRIISKDEFGFVEYHVVRILTNDYVREYLFNICHFAFKVLNEKKEISYNEGNKNFSFRYLLEYGVKNKLINEDIYNKNNELYEKNLNF